jgi:hypothetical protein
VDLRAAFQHLKNRYKLVLKWTWLLISWVEQLFILK